MSAPTANPSDARIPVTVVTGFLGSGKTTLLNHVLTRHHGRRIAVIENEFGEIGIDHELVVKADEEIFEMNNGCICCTVRGDLIRILGQLARRRDKFDYVLIETTGLADPGPVAQTFFVDEAVREQFRLDGIVTLVDARHVGQHIDDSSECQEQIAFADRILLNKTDLVSAADLGRLESTLQQMNATATILRTSHAEVPIEAVLDLRAFDLDTKLALDADFLKEELPFEWGGIYGLKPGAHTLVFEPGPDPIMGLVLLPLPDQSPESWDWARREAVALFQGSLQSCPVGGTLTPGSIGWKLVFGDDESRWVVRIAEPGGYALFTQHLPSEFNMEFHRNGEVLAPVVAEEFAAGHTHDASVTSVGIREPGPLDLRRLEDWMGELLRTRGPDIFRMKGVLHIRGIAERFVFQGVHMLFDGRPDRLWREGEDRTNQLVFIGRNLNREALINGFRRCLAG
jgi:G3E family GTPase